MKTNEASTVTRAPAAAVWERWTRPELWPEHNDDLVSASLAGDLAVGATIAMRPKRGPASTVSVTAVDPYRRFTTVGRMPGCRLEIDHRMETAAGITRFTHRFSMAGPLTPIFWQLFGKRLSTRLPVMVANIARLAEAPGGG